jgi:hypothetical protein
MTPNFTLSIPNALRRDRPEDYYKNISTIEWPLGPSGESFPIVGLVFSAVVFNGGRNVAAAEEFVRFLVSEGWLAHYLDFSAERMMPPLPGLLNQPFWLDPSDPHRMAAVMQVASRPLMYSYVTVSGDRVMIGSAIRRMSGATRFTASRPRASVPSRRSTRRSPGSSRSSPSSGAGPRRVGAGREAARRSPQLRYAPPLTSIVAPVMKAESASLARNR